jgi:ribosomal protein L34E
MGTSGFKPDERRGGLEGSIDGGRSRIRTYDFHRVKVAKKTPARAIKGVKSRTSGKKPAFQALFATKLLPKQ